MQPGVAGTPPLDSDETARAVQSYHRNTGTRCYDDRVFLKQRNEREVGGG